MIDIRTNHTNSWSSKHKVRFHFPVIHEVRCGHITAWANEMGAKVACYTSRQMNFKRHNPFPAPETLTRVLRESLHCLTWG